MILVTPGPGGGKEQGLYLEESEMPGGHAGPKHRPLFQNPACWKPSRHLLHRVTSPKAERLERC